MWSFNNFSAGFLLGFGAGIMFKSLSDNDFEPVKEIMHSGANVAYKVGDGVAEMYGRLRENIEDMMAGVRAEKVVPSRRTPSRKSSVKSEERLSARAARKPKTKARNHAHKEVHA